ncbi:MAG: S-adenosylmethionine synthetase N-terminal domain-containing protein, partial [Desulfobacterales bacterium]
MSKIRAEHIFTSESVANGHPDKLCDQVSDAILDACLARDPVSRVACETLAGYNLIVNVGEITCNDWESIDTESIVRSVVEEIGYADAKLKFWNDSFDYICRIHGQSPDISQGVSAGEGLYDEQGAGDQGMMFGYATNENEEMLPSPIAYSHRILKRLETARKQGDIGYLRPDAKSQVSVKYRGGRPEGITSVVVSHQTDDVPLEKIRKELIAVVKDELDATGLVGAETQFYINPTGA